MSLAYGILGFLAYGDMTGYDLAKAFDSSVKSFWHAQKAQIYQTLGKLERQGLVAHERIVQNARPNKKLYAITDEGRSAFLAWLADGSGDVDFKSSFLMKLFFSGSLPVDQAIDHMEAFIADCEEFAEAMQKTPEVIESYGASAPAGESVYWGFTADFGARYIEMCLEWARDTLEKLEGMR
ncbi:PadR family transcriptional regulator [Curtanaerobium respiraculi]|uniref:PadR family transcriptional regulator n=1 Tax=Curtanaerobium respiraculi TaxID=2949669 RepID=UPI0024B3A40A|nr:PadR family transcriptional regulator [Curtanaerobium respiraculi]